MYKGFDCCDWAVFYIIPGSLYDDGIPCLTVVGWFKDPVKAEDFIKKCLPDETRDRFMIKHRDELKKMLI